MKIVCLSDTHTKHRQINIPKGDILIHAGDICHRGKDEAILQDFNEWLATLPHKYKIVTAGNHDYLLEQYPEKAKKWLSNAIYLEDEGTEIEGIKIWASPVTPRFLGLGFNRKTREVIRKHWEKIPLDTDLLITHSPAHKIRDKSFFGLRGGCRDLKEFLPLIQPKLHVFGHIHEDYGQTQIGNTLHLNASVVDYKLKPIRSPWVIDWKKTPLRALS